MWGFFPFIKRNKVLLFSFNSKSKRNKVRSTLYYQMPPKYLWINRRVTQQDTTGTRTLAGECFQKFLWLRKNHHVSTTLPGQRANSPMLLVFSSHTFEKWAVHSIHPTESEIYPHVSLIWPRSSALTSKMGCNIRVIFSTPCRSCKSYKSLVAFDLQ